MLNKPFVIRLIYLSMTCFFSTLVNAQLIVIEPANPRGGEVVRAQILWEGVPANELPVVSMTANKIRVDIKYSGPFIPGGLPTPRTDVVLGQLPAGNYELEYYIATTSPSPARGSVQFTVQPATTGRTAPYPFFDYTDLWWNAAESGWGISIHVKNDKLFAAWFAYDAAGKPNWYTFQAGNWTSITNSSATYTGLVVKANGPSLLGIAGPGGTITPAQAGTATLTFNSYSTATFSGTVDGQSFNKSIVRQPF